MHAVNNNAFALTKIFLRSSLVQAQETFEVATVIQAVAAPTTDANKPGDERVVRPWQGVVFALSSVSFPPPSASCPLTASRAAFNTCQCRYLKSSHYPLTLTLPPSLPPSRPQLTDNHGHVAGQNWNNHDNGQVRAP